MRRDDVASTLIRRHFGTKCSLDCRCSLIRVCCLLVLKSNTHACPPISSVFNLVRQFNFYFFAFYGYIFCQQSTMIKDLLNGDPFFRNSDKKDVDTLFYCRNLLLMRIKFSAKGKKTCLRFVLWVKALLSFKQMGNVYTNRNKNLSTDLSTKI